MTSKQRVQAALRKQPVDRVPSFLWFHPHTRPCCERAATLRRDT